MMPSWQEQEVSYLVWFITLTHLQYTTTSESAQAGPSPSMMYPSNGQRGDGLDQVCGLGDGGKTVKIGCRVPENQFPVTGRCGNDDDTFVV